VARPYEGVSNLVQDRVSDLWLRVQEREFPAQSDRACAVLAGTESTHGSVELEVPMGQIVFGHQLARDCFGVFENHRLIELSFIFRLGCAESLDRIRLLYSSCVTYHERNRLVPQGCLVSNIARRFHEHRRSIARRRSEFTATVGGS
jgi:hypothetical protein